MRGAPLVGLALLTIALMGAVIFNEGTASPPPGQQGPSVIMKGHVACADCHQQQVDTWKISRHFSGFSRLPGHEDVADILKAVDPAIKDMRASSRCATCHFTRADGAGKYTWGPTCESCHAPRGDNGWFEIHNLFRNSEGKRVRSAVQEGPEMKKKRHFSLDTLGMNRPGQIYAIAMNCLTCHAIPDEGLVNRSKHVNGLGNPFELVSFSQGHVKHNFKNGGKENVALSGADLRRWYVIGQMAVLDHSLRALATAKKGKYASAQVSRIRTVSDSLADVLDATNAISGLEDVLDAIPRRPRAGDAGLTSTADLIRKIALTLQTSDVFKDLKALDALIPQDRH